MDAETKRYIDQKLAQLEKKLLAEIRRQFSNGQKSQNNNNK